MLNLIQNFLLCNIAIIVVNSVEIIAYYACVLLSYKRMRERSRNRIRCPGEQSVNE